MRRVLALTTALSLALGGCGAGEPESRPVPIERLAGAPAALGGLHDQANELLGGGIDAYRARLERLEGYPVVVNKWASWCAPCRAEFPLFQRVSVRLGKRVAFLGVNTNDNDGAAADFLERYPVSYPSFKDGNSKIGNELGFGQAFPVTAFYDRKGKLTYTHPGPYRTDDELTADIRRYAK